MEGAIPLQEGFSPGSMPPQGRKNEGRFHKGDLESKIATQMDKIPEQANSRWSLLLTGDRYGKRC